MDEKERKAFDRELDAPLERAADPARVADATMPSRAGVTSDIEAMMTFMGMPQAGV